jgi:uncharacterized protein (TIGR00290 family)
VSVVFSWSGGKDSALGLWTMREETGVEPAALLTTVNEDFDRISIHGVRRELLHAQAAALGLPLVEVAIPAGSSNELYEERLAAALTSPDPLPSRSSFGPVRSGGRPLAPTTGQGSTAPPLAEVEEIAFADLFLADLRAYRETQMAALGKRPIFPLWGRDTAALARTFIEAGFGATLVAVDTDQLDASFVGRRFDAALLDDLPEGVDPCGENGEFHTFVDSGPIFDRPIPVTPGERHDAGRFVYQDLVP